MGNRFLHVILILYFWNGVIPIRAGVVPQNIKDKTDLCGPRDWHHFGENKCFTFLDPTLLGGLKNFDEAKKLCTLKDPLSTLPSISSLKEQEFLLTKLVGESLFTENIWLGAQDLGRGEVPIWEDGLITNFTNWLEDNNFRNKTQGAEQCIQIESHRALKGKWTFTDCAATRNLIVCQKPQTWAPSKIQSVLLETRRSIFTSQDAFRNMEAFLQHFDAIQTQLATAFTILQNMTEKTDQIEKLRADLSESNMEITRLKGNVSGNQNELTNMKGAIHAAKEEIENLQARNISSPASTNSSTSSGASSSVPVGFIYVQYGSQNSAPELWPTFTWSEVTASYAGQFFRAFGPQSGSFGSVQQENAPRITSVTYKDLADHPHDVQIAPGQVSAAVRTGHWDSAMDKVGISFTMSGGEVRPRNSAVKIWKRTA